MKVKVLLVVSCVFLIAVALVSSRSHTGINAMIPDVSQPLKELSLRVYPVTSKLNMTALLQEKCSGSSASLLDTSSV